MHNRKTFRDVLRMCGQPWKCGNKLYTTWSIQIAIKDFCLNSLIETLSLHQQRSGCAAIFTPPWLASEIALFLLRVGVFKQQKEAGC